MGIYKKALNDLGITTLYEVRSLVNNYICEEMGISDYVDSETDKLYNIIIDKLTNKTQVNPNDEEDVDWAYYNNGKEDIKTIKHGICSFKYNFNKVDLNVSFEAFNFRDYYVRNEWKDVFPENFFDRADSSYGNAYFKIIGKDLFQKRLSLHILMVSGTVDKKLLHSSIRHELRHIYEQMCNNHTNFQKRKDDQLYKNSADAYNKSDADTPKSDVGFLGYMSFNYECHAFIEEYYDNIKYYVEKASEGDEESERKLSSYLSNDNEIMRKITKMRITLSKLQNSDSQYVEAANEMLKDTGFRLQDFIKRADKAINDLSRRYGKCVVKAKKDFPVLFDYNKYNRLTFHENKGKPYAEWYI